MTTIPPDGDQTPELPLPEAPQPEAAPVDAARAALVDMVVSDMSVRLVEALIFARAEPVSERAIAELLETQGEIPAGVDDLAAYTRATLDALLALYAGRGVMPVEVAGGWQFRTTPDLAPRLTRVLRRPRRLARSTMETLAIIAYHQPCTRAEIEGIRGVSLSQQVLDTLLEAELVVPLGRKEVPGRPILWGTSAGFLRHFGLRDLRDLPRREELLVDVPDLQPPGGGGQARGDMFDAGSDAAEEDGAQEGTDDAVCAPPDA